MTSMLNPGLSSLCSSPGCGHYVLFLEYNVGVANLHFFNVVVHKTKWREIETSTSNV